MVKIWSSDNPKAALMSEKRGLIVKAAGQEFLQKGYAESSVNRIAADAGVSIKTLYRHFESKDELFCAVMMSTCTPYAENQGNLTELPEWFSEPLEKGLKLAGTEYLKHALSKEQMSLYRVLARDAARFPQLARRYQSEFIGNRDNILSSYLDRALLMSGLNIQNRIEASATFAALLKTKIFDDVLMGLQEPDERSIIMSAERAASAFILLIKNDFFN